MSSLDLLVETKKIDISRLRDEISLRLGKSILTNWFSQFSILEQSDHAVVLAFESRFVKEWVSLNYHAILIALLKTHVPTLVELSYFVQENDCVDPVVISQVEDKSNKKILNLRNDNNKLTNKPVKNQFTFDNFETDRENLLAYTAIKNVASGIEAHAHSDLVFIYGNVGVGKTHLLKALSHELSTFVDPDKVLYSSSERFVYNYVKSLRSGNLVKFKESISGVDYLLIDDFQFVQAKGSSQQELLGFIDHFSDSNKKIVITADRAPNSFTEIDQKIVSRINGGLVLKIDTPLIPLKRKIACSKAEYNKIDLSSDIIDKIASSVYTIREIDGIISKLKIYKDIFATEISLELAREIIGDSGFNSCKEKRVTVEDIQAKVSHYFGLEVEDIFSQKRHKVVSRARHIAMYLAKIHTKDSLIVIAKKFNRLDHSTVAHAYSKIKKNISEYSEIPSIERKLTD